jgi:hypothetical protein
MKNVTVTVQIQFDVFGEDTKTEVENTLDQMSQVLGREFNDRSPVIFTNSIDNSDIEVHGMCQKYPDSEALPDEDDNCSLCGGDCCE